MVTYGGRPKTERKPVEVVARISPEGVLTPFRVVWPGGRRYDLTVLRRERTYDRRRRVSVTDFTVEVQVQGRPGHVTHLWYDGEVFWVEAKVR